MTTTPPTHPVLVVGATGYLGGRVVDELLNRGKTVPIPEFPESQRHPGDHRMPSCQPQSVTAVLGHHEQQSRTGPASFRRQWVTSCPGCGSPMAW